MDVTLDHEEVRVLGSLMEKEMSTPEYYPLSLNSLINACNQKTSRFPVVTYDEKLVLGALSRLREKRIVWQSESSRVSKYEQMLVKNRHLGTGEAAVLCVLMLRGPQTIGEIKAHTERLHVFSDLDAVEQILQELQEAEYVVRMPRQPGRKESRYAHLFSGTPEDVHEEEVLLVQAGTDTVDAREARISELEEQVRALRRDLEDFKRSVAAFMEEFK